MIVDKSLLLPNIKELCENNNTNIHNLEKALKFSTGVISRWDKADPSLSKVIAVAKYFNVSIDDLLSTNNEAYDEFIKSVECMTKNKSVTWKISEYLYDLIEFKAKEDAEDVPKFESNKQYINDMYDKIFNDYNSSIKSEDFKSLYSTLEIDSYRTLIIDCKYKKSICEPSMLKMLYFKDNELYHQDTYVTKDLLNLWTTILIKSDYPSTEVDFFRIKEAIVDKNKEMEYRLIDEHKDKFIRAIEVLDKQEFHDLIMNFDYNTTVDVLKLFQRLKPFYEIINKDSSE